MKAVKKFKRLAASLMTMFLLAGEFYGTGNDGPLRSKPFQLLHELGNDPFKTDKVFNCIYGKQIYVFADVQYSVPYNRLFYGCNGRNDSDCASACSGSTGNGNQYYPFRVDDVPECRACSDNTAFRYIHIPRFRAFKDEACGDDTRTAPVYWDRYRSSPFGHLCSVVLACYSKSDVRFVI